MPDSEALKQKILRLTREYSHQVHGSFRPAEDPDRKPWQQGNPIPYAGRVFTEDEVEAAVSATLDFWLTLGTEGEAFQNELAAFLGVRACLAVNSGSSANLLALSALTSPLLPSERRLLPGDEVITCAAGFPTTVTPILQNGCIPVFLDNDPVTGNLRVDQLEQAYVPGRRIMREIYSGRASWALSRQARTLSNRGYGV
jgi:CDP-6-deoxy-D-xylo-4-hexulose-3-dehydrase